MPLSQHPRREDCLIGRIHLRPLIEDEDTLLTVTCGDLEAVANVYVRPTRFTPDPVPPEDLEFEKPKYQMAHGRRRNLVLRAPSDVINTAGTTRARVASSDQGIVVLGQVVELDFDEDEMCFMGKVMVDPRVLGANAVLTATLGEAVATCEVAVREREGGGPSLQIKIVDESMGRFRAFVDVLGEGTVIKIMGRNPAIQRYLGPSPAFENQNSPQARAVIAEIVAGEAARLVVRRKYATPGELDGEGFDRKHLGYLEKYLPRCHRMLLSDLEDGQ